MRSVTTRLRILFLLATAWACCYVSAAVPAASPSATSWPIDTTPLLRIEQRVLPPALVEGPNSQPNLSAYYTAANPQLSDRLEQIRHLYQSHTGRPYRAITLVAGDAGIGKSFLKKQVFSKEYPRSAVFKLDIRQQYEQWYKEGIVQRQPDLQCGDVVINTLLASKPPQAKLILPILNAQTASFYVIDSLDEVHPDEYVSILEQIESFVQSTDNDFVHVVVFGRPCAFLEYGKKTHGASAIIDSALFMLQPPQFRTTGDLLVSSWNYASYAYDVAWVSPGGKRSPLLLQDYREWAQAGFTRTGKFHDISMKANQEIAQPVQTALEQDAQRYRTLEPLLHNLAGNSIIRHIITQQTLHDLPFDEHQMMESFFDAWLERDYESDGRPSYAHPEHVELYLQLLERVAVKYLVEGRLDEDGYFPVSDSDQVQVTDENRQLVFPVRRILDRSGMKHIDPCRTGPLKYRFEPIWLHRFLVDRYNSRIQASESMAHQLSQ